MLPVVGHLFWDELLMFVVPVLLVLVAVRWAERRRPPEYGLPEPSDDETPSNVEDDSANTGNES